MKKEQKRENNNVRSGSENSRAKQVISICLSDSWRANNRSTDRDIFGILYSLKYQYSVSESYINIDSILTLHIFNSLHYMYRLAQL
jgi:hypothetical protein